MVSKKQSQVLLFIGDFFIDHGYAPSLREISDHFHFVSPSTAHHHVTQLKEAGLLRHTPHANRSLELVGRRVVAAVELPLVGEIAAGAPIKATSQGETLAIPSALLGPRRGRGGAFVLRVKGDSMIDEAICDGDDVVVEKGDVARDGQTVVALLHGREATLKKFYREGDHVRLQPANENLPPILVHASRVEIQGIVRGVLRRVS